MVIINIYAPCSTLEKEHLWETIKLVVEQYDDRNICLVGDFNSIRDANERVGRREEVNVRDIKLFEDFISSSGLIDLPLGGRRFTWYRTDAHPDFREMCISEWSSYNISGWKSYSLSTKLKQLKGALKQWSRNTFSSLNNRIEAQKKNIKRLDKFDDVFGLEEEEIIERNRITAELRRNMVWKESFLFQKAKAKWIKEGDVNSSFFHGWINKRIKLNGIEGLLVDNVWVESREGIRKEVFTHFQNHFRSRRRIRVHMPNDICHKRLYRVSEQQHSSIKEMGRWCGGEWLWDFRWKRRLNERELDTVDKLTQVLISQVMQQQARDTWRWTGARDGKYSTKIAYHTMVDSVVNLDEEEENKAFKIMWNCSFSKQVWSAIYSWTDSVLAPHCVPTAHLLQHNYIFDHSKSEGIAASLWAATVGIIWKIRNLVVFEDAKPNLFKAIGEIKAISWSWLKAKPRKEHNFSFSEWCSNPRKVILELVRDNM
ncbi:hypothetical protein ACS0TY_004253 [Phlomoides rotata]